ncbi:MAG: hypothetical protein ACRCWG_00685 [Sarcina sp.]
MFSMSSSRREFNKLKMVFIINILIGILTTVYIFFGNTSPLYVDFYVLPLAYLVCSVIFGKWIFQILMEKGWVMKVVFGVIFIRYILTPISVVLTNNYSGFGNDPAVKYMNFAYVLMIIELVTTIIAMVIINYFTKRSYSGRHSTRYNRENKDILKNKFLISIFIILAIIAYFLHILDFLAGFKAIVLLCLKVSIYLLIVSYIKKGYEYRRGFVYHIAFIVVTIGYLAAIFSDSRWNILIAILASAILYIDIFGKINKYLIILGLCIFGVLFMMISMKKFHWVTIVHPNENPVLAVVKMMMGQFQSYFSGPRTVALGIQMKEHFGNAITYSTLSNDFLGSVPGLARHVDQANRINYFFNWFIFGFKGKLTLIIPMVAIGYVYFGVIGCSIFSIICVVTVMLLGQRMERIRRLEYKYVLVTIAFLLSMYGGFNTQIIFGNLVSQVIPVLLLFYFNDIITLERVKRIFKRRRSKY